MLAPHKLQGSSQTSDTLGERVEIRSKSRKVAIIFILGTTTRQVVFCHLNLFTMIAMRAFLGLFVLAQATGRAVAYSIDTSETSLTLVDTRTGLPANTLFIDESTDAMLHGLLWEDGLASGNTTQILHYRTLVNGKEIHQGYLALPEDPLELPTSIYAGIVISDERGTTDVTSEFWIDGEKDNSISIEIQSYPKWLASIPMILICILGFVTDLHVIYSLLIGLFVGGCMVEGSFVEGFKSIITKYIITVASEEQHVYLYTFTLVVAGLAAMIRRSGGVAAVIERISQYSNSIVIGQVMVLVAGIILFFDPYASIIFIGELVSPFFRMFPVSLEKYAFLIQTTGVPVAAINPLSTWVGFSSALIQSQIDRLVDMGYEDLTIPDDGWMVFVRSIKYQFYPIFILCLVPMLIVSRRDLGPMLVKERERWLFLETGGITKSTLREKISRPSSDIPRLARNMWVPIGFWSISIWLTFGFISDPDSADNSTDFLAALIYSTIGAAAVTQFFYMLQRLEIQPKNGDHITEYGANRSIASALNMSRRSSRSIKSANADFILKNLQSSVSEDSELIGKVISHEGEQDEDDADIDIDLEEPNDELEDEEPLPLITKKRYKALVSLKEGANCFFKGGATVTPVLMTLTLAWATTAVFLDLGLDRLFADLINRGSIQTEMYATIGFFISCLLALATGSSTAAQAIVLPLLAIPLYVETDGNADLFYGLVGAVFSGSVVGDHASPISTSSILSSIIIECDLRDHILTQSPYIVFVAFLSVFAGHIPSAFERYPYYYGYAVGFVLLCCFVFFYCVDVLNEEGKYDFITSRFLSGRFASERLKDLKTRICMANGIEIIELKENLAALDTESASEPPSFETYDPQEYSRTMQTPDEDESVASSATSMSESISYKGRRGQNNSGRSNRSNHAGSRSRSRSTSRRSKRSLVDEQQAPSTPRKDASPSTRQSRTKSPSTRSHRSSSRSRPEGKTREVIQPKEQPRPSAPVEEEEPVGMKNNVMNWLRDAMSEDSTTTSGM